jgi:hypothetical protein
MKPAIIDFKEEILVASGTTERILVNAFIPGFDAFYFQMDGLKSVWKLTSLKYSEVKKNKKADADLHASVKLRIDENLTELNEYFKEKELVYYGIQIISGTVPMIDQNNDFTFKFLLKTFPFTIIDQYNDKLILCKGNQTDALKGDQQLTDLYIEPVTKLEKMYSYQGFRNI